MGVIVRLDEDISKEGLLWSSMFILEKNRGCSLRLLGGSLGLRLHVY